MGITLRVRGQRGEAGGLCQRCTLPLSKHDERAHCPGFAADDLFEPDTETDPIVEARIENEDGTPAGGWLRVSHRRSLKHVNHSPTGFAWGYAGSGPSQLAFAILETVTDAEIAQRHYQRFKFATVARVADQFTPFEFTVDVERFLATTGDDDRHVSFVTGLEAVPA